MTAISQCKTLLTFGVREVELVRGDLELTVEVSDDDLERLFLCHDKDPERVLRVTFRPTANSKSYAQTSYIQYTNLKWKTQREDHD